MVKDSSLSSDIDLIKEFEELKLKQKILVESLNRKNKSKEKEFLIELNSKLDFLIKIFRDTSDTDFNEQEYLDQKFSELMIKIEDIEKNLNQRVTEIHNIVKTAPSGTISEPMQDNRKENDSEDLFEDKKEEETKSTEPIKEEPKRGEVTEETKPKEEPQKDEKPTTAPKPDFEVGDDKVEDLSKSQSKPKKGWF